MAQCVQILPATCNRQSPGVEAQSLSFQNVGNSYTLDVFSAYAPQSPRAGAPWCLRYEAANTSRHDIGLFSLPIAPLQDDPLRAGSRDFVVVTRSSVNTPSVAETVVFAFKSNAMRTRAYQVKNALPGLISTRQYAEATSRRNIAEDPDHLIGTLRVAEHISVQEPTDLFVLGADFSGGGTTMSVASRASYDGKYYTIHLGIETEGPVKQVRAPYFNMLQAANLPDDLLSFLQEPQSFSFPLKTRNVTKLFHRDTIPLNLLYIVDQPITLLRGDGSVACIMAPAYSPAPIPPSTFSCNFIR